MELEVHRFLSGLQIGKKDDENKPRKEAFDHRQDHRHQQPAPALPMELEVHRFLSGLQIGKKDDVNKKDSKQPRHDAMKRLSRLSNDRSGTEIRPQRHDAMKRLSRLSNDRSGTEISV
ncbi:hypothetical protein BOX15_Mlig012913g2 [Macrostomum lignano]|uniref:Uncharacterized protein n=1 Tax=Macrostomum lignano TaxID=282301 RepID=A0A267G4C2_9PLAT|nr:hypothetical protein BOX15_Mlig012913g2 [Macrostomum lignano]